MQACITAQQRATHAGLQTRTDLALEALQLLHVLVQARDCGLGRGAAACRRLRRRRLHARHHALRRLDHILPLARDALEALVRHAHRAGVQVHLAAAATVRAKPARARGTRSERLSRRRRRQQWRRAEQSGDAGRARACSSGRTLAWDPPRAGPGPARPVLAGRALCSWGSRRRTRALPGDIDRSATMSRRAGSGAGGLLGAAHRPAAVAGRKQAAAGPFARPDARRSTQAIHHQRPGELALATGARPKVWFGRRCLQRRFRTLELVVQPVAVCSAAGDWPQGPERGEGTSPRNQPPTRAWLLLLGRKPPCRASGRPGQRPRRPQPAPRAHGAVGGGAAAAGGRRLPRAIDRTGSCCVSSACLMVCARCVCAAPDLACRHTPLSCSRPAADQQQP